MEFVLEGTIQVALLSRDGACMVNVPSPSRFAVHKLIVAAERRTTQRTKSTKDIAQSAALAEWHLLSDQGDFKAAWKDALSRGRGWKTRAQEGRCLLLQKHPQLDDTKLW